MIFGFTAIGFVRGHEVIWSDELKQWIYADNGEIKERYRTGTRDRACIKCGKMPTPEGHDACLGTLPGIKFACCGHGIDSGYRSET